ELEESVTDPDINAWYDSRGQENADKCAWSFGTTYPLPNGSVANMRLGARDFLIQRNWVNDSGGYCDLTYPGRVGPRISSFNPTQGHPGDSLTINGINFVNVSNLTVAGVQIVSFTVVSDMRIDATLPPDAPPAAGPITVTTPDGTGISTVNYTILGPAPTISSFAPGSGHPGDSVDIFGTNFVQFISGEAVKIAGLDGT